MIPTKIAFEQQYSDDSGVEFAVRLDNGEIEFESLAIARFPAEELGWLIKCLIQIQDMTTKEIT
jgi:hypothetical protein